MKRSAQAVVCVAGVLALAAAGCKKSESPAAPVAADAPAGAQPAKAVAAAPSGPPGSLEGVVRFEGTPPAPQPLKRGSDPVCAAGEKNDVSVLVKDGKLANVVVMLQGAVPESPPPAEPVTIDQRGCTYVPRVQGIVAGQKLLVTNSDAALHNVHGYAGKKTLSNQAQPPNAPAVEQKYSPEPGVVTLKCDVHPWMVAHVVVAPNRYFGVTGEDGTFRIADVPPGTYTVEAWHEKLGTRTKQVTVEPGKPSSVELGFAPGA